MNTDVKYPSFPLSRGRGIKFWKLVRRYLPKLSPLTWELRAGVFGKATHFASLAALYMTLRR